MKEVRGGEWRDFVRFVFAAGASVPFNVGSRIWFSTWMDFRLAIVLAHCVGMVTAYSLTRLFVFRPSGRPVPAELARFVLVNMISVSITWIVSVALFYEVFPLIGFSYHAELVAHVLGLACSAITSFIGHSRFTFKRVSGAT